MKSLLKQYGVIFLIGFASLAVALSCSMIAESTLLSEQSFIVALRTFGLGAVAAAMALWAALRREEAGKPVLTTLFGFLVIAGVLLLVLALLFHSSGLSRPARLAGLAFTLSALVIGVLAMIFAPAYPRPVAKVWPVGAEAVLTRFANYDSTPGHHEEHEQEVHAAVSSPPDDLTRIEGIGPRLTEVLAGAGVTTFAALAALEPDAIDEMVKKGGFKAPFNPVSWPQQAALAAEGRWDELDTLKEQMVSGRLS